MKLSRTAKYGIAGMGLVLLLFVGLLIYATSGSKKIGPVVDPTKCEFCGGSLNKGDDCPKCMAEMGRDKYIAKRESKNWYNSPLIASIVIGSLSLLVIVHFSLVLSKYLRRRKGDVFYHTRCPKCGRKLRYRDSQVEHLGRCPLCQKPIRFPKPVLPPKVTMWNKVRGLTWRRIREIVWD
jgi:predicted Zn-ribbon and HTH transcriptional regulator